MGTRPWSELRQKLTPEQVAGLEAAAEAYLVEEACYLMAYEAGAWWRWAWEAVGWGPPLLVTAADLRRRYL